ncbi:SDR family NAD(P)-dependent oxidoreductase [Mycobacterium sp.]|uniref:SDR family NAD(P)-dependent oxidoreductase n=1 Tax=Mycobacterium sp. TaxID=1785 RepID=UPI003A84DA60
MEVVIITGAGSGIGLATAKEMHGRGLAVLGVGRDQGKLDALAAEVGASERLATLSADITTDEAPQRVVQAALERFGGINYLVNNAGIGSPKPLHETDDATLDHFLDIMLRAPFRLARDVIAHMQPGSAIINVTSTFAVVGGRRGGAYSAAKGGLTSLTQHIACEYGATGIRANCVAPGVTMTDMVRERMNDKGFRRMQVDMTPYPRLGEAEDVASTIAFLCSRGGEFINGQTIVVDGGWSATKYLSPEALNAG